MTHFRPARGAASGTHRPSAAIRQSWSESSTTRSTGNGEGADVADLSDHAIRGFANRPEAEIEASTAKLLISATNDNAAPKGGGGRSMGWLRGQDLNL